MRIEVVSKEFIQAINEVASYVPVLSEDVHVPGYGMVSLDRAKKEADLAHSVAHEHTIKGNHIHAAYQHERAAMFHRAIHNHLESQRPVSQESASPQRADLNVPESVVLEGSTPESRELQRKIRITKLERYSKRKYVEKSKEKDNKPSVKEEMEPSKGHVNSKLKRVLSRNYKKKGTKR
jgi:hypothetical protein